MIAVGVAVLAAIGYGCYRYGRPILQRYLAVHGDFQYPKGYTVHGIDISHHQGTINWKRLRRVVIDSHTLTFVVIKSTEGASYYDHYFKFNYRQASEAGFVVGAYHFFNPLSSGSDQAWFYLRNVKLKKGDMRPVLDVEIIEKNDVKLSKEELRRNVLEWMRVVENFYGVPPILYTYKNFKELYLDGPEFDKYPLWLAHYYVPTVQYEGKWQMWQYSEVGKLPGISKHVDMNIFNGSKREFFKLTLE